MNHTDSQKTAIIMIEVDLIGLLDAQIAITESERFYNMCISLREILKTLIELDIIPTISLLSRLEMIINMTHYQEMEYEIKEYTSLINSHRRLKSLDDNQK